MLDPQLRMQHEAIENVQELSALVFALFIWECVEESFSEIGGASALRRIAAQADGATASRLTTYPALRISSRGGASAF